MEAYATVGKRLPRVDSQLKATGRAKYFLDMKLPGMLHVKVLRSPYAHARILTLDTSRAEKLPGVRKIITGKDVPDTKMGYRGGSYYADRYVLAKEKVRYVGDEIAAVAAIDEEIAAEAVELIRVEYEQLPAVFDAEEAMQPGAPLIHDHVQNNTCVNVTLDYGDIEAGFAEADYIFEDTFVTQPQAHCCPERRGWIADFDPAGRLTLYTTSQSPQHFQRLLANYFGIPSHKVKVVFGYIGGGFGSKGTFGLAPVPVILSRLTGKPVSLIYTREEEFIYAGYRYPTKLWLKTGVSKDGRILTRHYKCIMDMGAYYQAANIVMANLARQATILYAPPNVRFDGHIVYTNKPWAGGCRGLGRPQSLFALESQTDIIAEKLGIDPVQIRLINANQPNSTTCDGRKITTCGMAECIERAAQAAGWKEKRGKQQNRGLGIACMASACGGMKQPPWFINYAESIITVNEEGLATLLVAEPEVGTGTHTVLSLIAAEVLGVPIEDVQIGWGDTESIPLASWGTGASRVTSTAGNSAKAAALDARRQLFEAAAQVLEANIDDLEAKDRKIYVKGSPDKFISIADAVKHRARQTGLPVTGKGQFDDPYSNPADANGFGGTSQSHTFAAQIAEVEVDPRTGNIKLLNFIAAHDVGYAINPLGVEGQVEGAVSWGVGYGLMEELERKDGRMLNPNYMDYRVPTSLDMPPIVPICVETNEPRGPFGAKGIAEPPGVPTAPAIINAIYDAVGVRIYDLPVTPVKIRQAIREKQRTSRIKQ